MKAKRIKAVLGWALFGIHGRAVVVTNWEPHESYDEKQRLAMLPADAESYERMVEQMDVVIEKAINRWLAGYGGQDDLPRAALRAIGITAPKRGKKGTQ